ncbi:hypothetical protein [Flavobacterium sp. 316]|nr:hypothetical protein [Flavobacterium sp. 316]
MSFKSSLNTRHTKNYYNIPDFEKQWKEAKQEGDGVPLPGE